MTTSTNGVVGTSDQVTPIYNPEARFQVFKKSEIFYGDIGENRYVPNVGDLVIDMDLGGLQYEVISVDSATLIPVLKELKVIVSDGEITDNDLLLGVGPGTQADTYRIYIDTSVTPFAVAVDERLTVCGSMAKTAKIFKGADLSNEGNVISHIYDATGNILSNAIPLEVVRDLSGNITVKTVPVCYTTTSIADGEVLTVVIYSDDGHVVSKRQLLAENSSFIRSASTGVKYVTDISLECPFLSTTDSTRINLPINVLLSGLNMMGVVHYSDGSTRRLPVDGTKFNLLGMSSYLDTVVNNTIPVILNYTLDADEIAYSNNAVNDYRFFTKNYKIVTMQQDGAYSVKLYAYPVWQDAVNGYRLRWWLYNVDRSVTYEVTSLISYQVNTPAFNPILYGTQQQLSVAVNLSDVNPAYKNYRHAQVASIVLWGPGTQRTTNWTIAFATGQNPVYGENNYASLTFINYNLYTLNLSMGLTDRAQWLDRLYSRTEPLIDQYTEQTPPTPTHFRLRFGNFDQYFSIDNWNQDISIGNGLNNNDTLFIEFIYRTPNNDLQLSIAGVPIYQTTP